MKFYAPKYKQLDLGLLRSSLDELDKTNRWVALGDLLLWTELEKEYNSRLDNQKKGAGNKPARMILGAMIIKHKLNLSDAETIEIIRESPYMQYFCGLHEFTDKPIFDPSLFVTIRKRISEEELNKMTVKLLNKQKRLLEEKRKREEEEAKKIVALRKAATHVEYIKSGIKPAKSSTPKKGIDSERNIVNMYNNNYTIDDIWKVSGFRSRSSVFRILNKYGVKLNRGKFSGPLGKRKPKDESEI